MKAAAFLLGLPLVVLVLSGLLLVVPLQPLNVALPLAGALALPIVSAIDAARDARRLRGTPRPWYSRWYACAAVWLLTIIVLTPAWTAALRTSWARAFRIPNRAMEPTVLEGDHLLVSRWAYGLRVPYSSSTVLGWRVPERGDLIAFRFSEDPRRVFLKRVVGLPGEEIEIRDERVYVDGRPLEEPYASFLDPARVRDRRRWGPERIPSGQLFVLGDNRHRSRDSRYWGFVPIADLLGRAEVVCFSWDTRNERIRWGRIGQRLR